MFTSATHSLEEIAVLGIFKQEANILFAVGIIMVVQVQNCQIIHVNIYFCCGVLRKFPLICQYFLSLNLVKMNRNAEYLL